MRIRRISKLAGLLAVVIAASFAAGCGITRVEPGHVAIVVDLAGSQRGVQDYTLRTGWVTYSPLSTQVIEYPTSVQTASWTKSTNEGAPTDESITFTTKEGTTVNADISLSYNLNAAKIPQFYVTFRNDDLSGFTYGYLHNIARDAFNNVGGSFTVQQVMGDNAHFLAEVQTLVSKQVEPLGVNIMQFGFIGAPRPPQGVIQAINASQQAQYIAQQKTNELMQAQADANKRVAQAEGEAKANEALAKSISPELLQWRAYDIQDRWINRWNGRTPEVTAGNSGNMLYTLPATSNNK